MILRPYPALPYPMQLPGLIMWNSAYDPNNNGTLASAGGLSAWVNKTGFLANSAIQASGVSQPTYTLNSLNGRPTLAFSSGVGTNMQNNQQVLFQLGITFSIFALVALTSSSNVNQTIVCKGVQDYILQLNRTSATSKLSLWDGTNWHDSTNTIVTTNYNFVGAVSDGSSVQLYSNNVNLGTSGVPTTPPASATNLIIGAQSTSSLTNFLSGNLAEVLIYKTALTSTQVTNLSNFFANFNGLNF